MGVCFLRSSTVYNIQLWIVCSDLSGSEARTSTHSGIVNESIAIMCVMSDNVCVYAVHLFSEH